MRKLLTSMLTLTLVCGSLITTPVLAEDTSASTNSEPSSTVKSEEVAVTFMFMDGDNARSIKSLMFAKGTHNYSELESYVPEGYEMTSTGDWSTDDVKVSVSIQKIQQPVEPAKKVNVSLVFAEDGKTVKVASVTFDEGTHNYSELESYVPAGYKITSLGDWSAFEGSKVTVNVEKIQQPVEPAKKVNVSLVFAEDGKTVKVASVTFDEGTHKYSELESYVPAGYKITSLGDWSAFEGSKVTVNVEKIQQPVEPVKKVAVTFLFTVDGKTVKVLSESFTEGVHNYSELESYVPNGYTMTSSGDWSTAEGKVTVNIQKIVNKKLVYVSYIDSETKQPLNNAIEKVEIDADATVFHSSILKAIPAEYTLAYGVGDIYVGEGDTVNVEVTKLAEDEKKVFVSYIDEETKMPLENAIEIIVLGVNDTTFHTSILKSVPEDYEIAVAGDVYVGEGDTVNVEVRKTNKTVYVSYIDEANKTPFENGIEKITVKADATTFNTSILKEVPAGFELVLNGDIYFGDNDTVNVEVRKVTTPSKPQGDNKPNTGASSSDKNHKKPVAAVATPLPGANYTYVVPNTATK